MPELSLHDPIGAVLILYAGPEQILPLISGLASLVGLILIWWQRLWALVRKTTKSLFKKMSRAHSKE